MRWALTLYIVAQFFGGDPSGQGDASRTYGAYLALVYATAIFGGYVADRMIGYQRSILLGAVIMGARPLHDHGAEPARLHASAWRSIIVGNGLFKPNISTMVGQLYARRRSAPRPRLHDLLHGHQRSAASSRRSLTGWLASVITNTPQHQNYKVVFVATGVGMAAQPRLVLVRTPSARRHRPAAAGREGPKTHARRDRRLRDRRADRLRADREGRCVLARVAARRAVRRRRDRC